MKIEFDFAKDKENMRKHGVSLSLAEKLDWDTAVCYVDNRFIYGETRFNCLVLLDDVLYNVTYTDRAEDVFRVISLRKAERSEVMRYYRGGR